LAEPMSEKRIAFASATGSGFHCFAGGPDDSLELRVPIFTHGVRASASRSSLAVCEHVLRRRRNLVGKYWIVRGQLVDHIVALTLAVQQRLSDYWSRHRQPNVVDLGKGASFFRSPCLLAYAVPDSTVADAFCHWPEFPVAEASGLADVLMDGFPFIIIVIFIFIPFTGARDMLTIASRTTFDVAPWPVELALLHPTISAWVLVCAPVG
jgi:hypothetical protein